MKLLYVLLIVVFQLIDQSITTSDLDCSFSLFIYILFIVLIANLCCYKMIIIIRNAYEREREVERGVERYEREYHTHELANLHV